jgi:hypothetical protein
LKKRTRRKKMYICINCGKIYEDYEVETTEEMPYGEEHCGLGAPIWETKRVVVDDECECGGEIVKAIPCENCDGWTSEGDTLCRDCVDNYKTLGCALEIGADYECDLSLNGFLATAFSKEEIEMILLEKVKESPNLDKIVKDYCEEDEEYFWGYAERKWNEER